MRARNDQSLVSKPCGDGCLEQGEYHSIEPGQESNHRFLGADGDDENISGVDLKGNLDFVLIGLTAGVSLSGATGYTAGGANPYVRFSTAGLKAGKSISLVLKFAIPTTITAFNYSFKTFTN